MTKRGPTEVLDEEHRVIQRVVAAMAMLGAALEMGKDLKAETLLSIVEFMRTFAAITGRRRFICFPCWREKGCR